MCISFVFNTLQYDARYTQLQIILDFFAFVEYCYLYGKMSEYSRLRHPGQVPWFVPMVSDPNSPWCMRFWFHMFGPLVGSLRVLIRVHNMDTPSLRQVWTLSGSAGNAWFMAQVTVSSIHDFQVRRWTRQVWLNPFCQLPSVTVGRFDATPQIFDVWSLRNS